MKRYLKFSWDILAYPFLVVVGILLIIIGFMFMITSWLDDDNKSVDFFKREIKEIGQDTLYLPKLKAKPKG